MKKIENTGDKIHHEIMFYYKYNFNNYCFSNVAFKQTKVFLLFISQ